MTSQMEHDEVNGMKEETNAKKASLWLFVACFLAYMITSMTKNAFSAAIAAIVEDGFMTKSQAGLINGSYYIFYGGAQLFLAKLVDRVSPIKMLHMALLGALIAMIGFMITDSFVVMLVLWSLSGFMQSATWPATIRIISRYLITGFRGKAMTIIAFAYCAGAALNSLMVSVILKVSHWRTIFVFSALVIALCWIGFWFLSRITMPTLERLVEPAPGSVHEVKKHKRSHTWRIMLVSGIVLMIIPGLVRAMLDNGVKTWVPTMMVESYGISPSFASLLATILMFVNLSGVFMVNIFCPRIIKSEVAMMGVCFLITLPCFGLLTLIGKIPLFAAILLLTAITTLMYAGNQLLNIMVPAKFAGLNLTGGIASTLNAFACFGIVIANFGFGYLADLFQDWNAVIWVWAGMALVGALFCFLAARFWSRFLKKRGVIH